MTNLDYYVTFVFIVKICFVILAISDLVLKLENKHPILQKKVNYLKERCELVFKFFMSLFLIYIFYPRRKKPIELDFKSRLLLFVLGFVLVLSANWKVIIHDSLLYQEKNIIG
jgi:hypothetical protein